MIAILTPFLGTPKTGGQKYNFRFFEILLELKGKNEIELITDDLFKIKSSSLFFNINYSLALLKKPFGEIIFDGRMYPRMIIVVILLQIFRPKTRLIAIQHHYNFLAKENKKFSLIDRYLELFVLRNCYEIIVPSPYTKSLTERFFRRKKISYIPLGFHKKDTNSNRISTKKHELLFVGTVCKRKGVIDLVMLMNHIKDLNLCLNIVGAYNIADPYYINLQKRIEIDGLEDKVFLHGRLNNEQLEKFYLNSLAFVFPSRYEGFGMVIAEALGYGLPVIAYNNSAMPFLISHKHNGYLVESQKITELEKAVRKIYDLKHIKYRELQNGALSTFASLSSVNTMEELMKAWIMKSKH